MSPEELMSLRAYGTIPASFWTKGAGRILRGDWQAITVACYLLSLGEMHMSGIARVALERIAIDTGLPLVAARQALDRLRERAQFVEYDEQDGIVWVPLVAEMSFPGGVGPADNRRRHLEAYFEVLGPHPFVEEFRRRCMKALGKPLAEPLGGSGSGSGSGSDPEGVPLRAPSEAPSQAPQGGALAFSLVEAFCAGITSEGLPYAQPRFAERSTIAEALAVHAKAYAARTGETLVAAATSLGVAYAKATGGAPGNGFQARDWLNRGSPSRDVALRRPIVRGSDPEPPPSPYGREEADSGTREDSGWSPPKEEPLRGVRKRA